MTGGSRLEELLTACSGLLNLQKFYTAGPKEVRSWFVPRGATAPQAAGKIHSSFEKAFICAEIAKVDEWAGAGTEEKLRAKGQLKPYGKDYIMQENDVVVFKHNARD